MCAAETVLNGRSHPLAGKAKILLVGPPGAGKGTLSKNLCSLQLDHVSSGELFRQQVRSATPLGRRLKQSLSEGYLVPDGLTLELMRKWYFGRKTRSGFILDGFPRTLPQALAFDEWLEARGEKLDAVIALHLEEDEAVRRISRRRVCPRDGEVYHLDFRPPAKPGLCDLCGTTLVERSDDQGSVVRDRFRIYHRHTAPIIDHYRAFGLLVEINANRPASVVAEAILEQLESFLSVR